MKKRNNSPRLAGITLRIFFFGCLLALLFCTQDMYGADTKPLKATLVLEHAESSAWNDLLRRGFERGLKNLGMEGTVIVASPGPRQRETFINACKDSDLVLVASDNLHEALRDNAANFRRVKFGSIDAGIRAPNIMSITFADEQAAFLAGAAAAMLAASDKAKNNEKIVGWLSGADTPAMRSLFSGFDEGAHLADPAARVIQAVAGSFTDANAAAEKAKWLLDKGAKVIALAAGAGNPAALKEVLARGAIPVMLDRDENALVISKAVDKAVYEIMQSAASPKFRGKDIIIYDLANNGVSFDGVDAFARKNNISGDLTRRMRELRHELETGSIRLHSLRARTLCDCLE